jgi:hypothetical protein
MVLAGELGPALAPQVVGDLRAVHRAQQLRDFLRTRGNRAAHLADAKHGVGRAARHLRAHDVARTHRLDADRAGDAAQRAAPADDLRDRLLDQRILQRDDDAGRSKVRLDQRACPRRVVELHADEREIDRSMRELLRFVDVQRLHRHLVLALGAAEVYARALDALDVLGPRVDQGDVVARAREMAADIAADGAGADEQRCACQPSVCENGKPDAQES